MAVQKTSRTSRTVPKRGRAAAKKERAGGFFSDLFYIPEIDFELLTRRALLYLTVVAWGLLIVDVYVIASIFTDWTGVLGGAVRRWTLTQVGGASLVLLLFAGYLCLSVIARRTIPRVVGQVTGTILLFFCTALLLGLLDFAAAGLLRYGFFAPGLLGVGMAGWFFENLGPLGTTLVGVAAIALTLLCFGYTAPFVAVVSAMERFFAARERAPKEKAASAPEEAQEPETPEIKFRNVQSINGTYLYVNEPDDERKKKPGGAGASEETGEASEPSELGDEEDLGLPSPQDVVPVDEVAYEGEAAPVGQFPPPFELYGKEQDDEDRISPEMAQPWGERIIDSLAQFGIEAELAEILLGPTVIQFRIQPLPGVKVNKIVALSNDLAMALAVSSLRVEAPIPGKPYVGIEIPNPKRRGITLRSVLEEDEFQDTDRSLPLPMGVTINGDPLVVGLEDMPHLLVAGTTGSGKSVFVNSCIVGLCSMRKPDELKMVLVDPKRVEMAVYEKLPHLLTPPVTDPKKAVHVLGWAIREMERRYTCCASAKVRNLASYNEAVLPKDRLPHIVIVVDELADLMMTAAKEVEEYICRLAQMARAVGIHLVLATQRPSVNVITGLIKANVPARVAFTLPSMMDSRTILDTGGAEKLLGKGDMLFTSTQFPKPMRIQSPWIDEHAIARWIDYLVNMFGEPDYTDIEIQGDGPTGFEDAGGFDDALLDEAVRVVISTGMASASGLQRRLRVGFTRAGRLVDMMERAGIVGPADGSRPREILVDEDDAEEILDRLRSGDQ